MAGPMTRRGVDVGGVDGGRQLLERRLARARGAVLEPRWNGHAAQIVRIEVPGQHAGEQVPNTATPNEAPMERKKVAPEVATPRSL